MSLHFEYLPATGVAQRSLVLLHGWGCNREVWRPLLVFLRPGANITLVDLAGCAPGVESDKPLVLEQLLADILACFSTPAVVVGWSLGGQIALALAERAPDRIRAVVTLCSNPKFVGAADWPGMERRQLEEFRRAAEANPRAALQRFDTLQVTGAEDQRQLLRQLRHLRRPPASPALLTGLQWLETLDQRESLAALRQPQLHLLAGRDALVPIAVGRSLAALLAGRSNSGVKILPDACHLALLQHPADVYRNVQLFLAKTGGPGESPRPTPTTGAKKRDVAVSFSRAASAYDSAAHLQREVGEQLLTNIEGPAVAPRDVLDLGCGTGYFCAPLKNRYPRARYTGLDIAAGMVEFARGSRGQGTAWLVGDAEALPLSSGSFDLVFSSLALQWCYRPDHFFAELARILRPGGVCVFTTLGPDTLTELRAAWSAVDRHEHVNTFLPQGELEAAAARIPGLRLRLEREVMQLQYERVRDLLAELKALGAHNMNPSRPSGLTSRRTLQGMLEAYEVRRRNGVLPATYEVIFGVLEKV